MIKREIAELLERAGLAAQQAGDLPTINLAPVPVERSASTARGDYASAVAMKLARAAGLSPLQIAQRLVRHMPVDPAIARVDVAPPGFINFGLDVGWLQRQVDVIVGSGPDYGRVDIGQGQRVQVEFVSANPTGVLTAASGRAGALGDALANLLEFAGHRVEREYYVNDTGNQMQAFYASVMARYRQAHGLDGTIPEGGYHGPAIVAVAEEIKRQHGDRFLAGASGDALEDIGRLGLSAILETIRADLELLGVRYDRWYSEEALLENLAIEKAISRLRERSHVVERDGAVWFQSTELGDERDHVLIRSNGVPTYLAGDVAYHYDKLVTRNLDRVIDIWGADHHGHVPAMMAAVEALGIDRSRLTILIHQMVTIKRGTEIVRMSKRAGDYVALRDVIEELGEGKENPAQAGRDACRYFFLSRSPNAHIDFDLELAKSESLENPVYYVQYSHARAASILRRATDLDPMAGDVALLADEPELALIRKLIQMPEVIETAAAALEPHQLPYYTRELAGIFNQFYEQCRVLSPDPADRPRSLARLKLIVAAQTVLANCLRLMGMSALERMARLE